VRHGFCATDIIFPSQNISKNKFKKFDVFS
jgi:hypothetical protein